MFMSMLWDTIFQISDTYESAQVFLIDNHIPALRFGNADKPTVFAAGFGENEWQASVILLKFFEQLCANVKRAKNMSGIAVARAFKKHAFVVIPTVCPEKAGTDKPVNAHEMNALAKYLRFYPSGMFVALSGDNNGIYSPINNADLSVQSDTITKVLHACCPLPVHNEAKGNAAKMCHWASEINRQPAFLLSPASLKASAIDRTYRSLEETLLVSALL